MIAGVVRVRLVDAGEIRGLLPSVADVGGQVFSRPPWREPLPAARAVAARLLADSGAPGFAAAMACDGDEVYGFAYGHICSRLAGLTGRASQGDFTLKELAVVPDLRGHGVGAALHDVITRSAGDGPLWLTTHPAARAAVGLYRGRGWQAVSIEPTPCGARVIMRKSGAL